MIQFSKIMILTASIAILSSCTKQHSQNVTVIKDCTGSYLRIDNKDYRVCNLEMVSAFKDGEQISASYQKIKECHGSAIDAIVCMMVHQNEGWIEVLSVE